MSDDPSGEAWNPANPQSWNTYAYVLNDPINLNDPPFGTRCPRFVDFRAGDAGDARTGHTDSARVRAFDLGNGGQL